MTIQLKKEWVIPVAVGIVSFGSGAAMSHFLWLRRYKRDMVEINQEVEDLQSEQLQLDFERVERTREFNQVVQQASRILRDLKDEGQRVITDYTKRAVEDHPAGVDVTKVFKILEDPPESLLVHKEREAEVITIWKENGQDWDYEVEERKRGDKSRPYILHVDEYQDDMKEDFYSQSTLTYYEQDNVLTDENDQPIYNHETVVGELKFGHGSEDPHICFVRNERLQADYEIILDHGSFLEQVLGEQIEADLSAKDIKHSAIPKFRMTE